MSKQELLGARVMGAGQLLLFVVFVLCMFDFAGLSVRGHLWLSLGGYLTLIFSGVAMQFVGAAIPNMRFTPSK